MLFKVNPNLFVNTEEIETLSFSGGPATLTQPVATPRVCQVVFNSGRKITIPEAAGELLIQFTDSNSSLLSAEDGLLAEQVPGSPLSLAQAYTTGQPSPSLLTDRIAVYLRDNAPGGATLSELNQIAAVPELLPALQTLIAERVVFCTGSLSGEIDTNDPDQRYYHASLATANNF